MRAWTIHDQRGLAGLRLESLPDPEPATGEVVLRVRSAALNPADRYLAEGLYPARPGFPHVLGRDGVGEVAAVGRGVEGWRPGDTALVLRGPAGVDRHGTLAELVAVDAASLAPVPPGWSRAEAAGAALVYLTAHQAICQWDMTPPTVVLVSGASGGVGVATVQLAAALGHHVIGLSRSRAKAARLLGLGAARMFDPRLPDWKSDLKAAIAPRRVGLVVDTVGGSLFPELLDTLGFAGRMSVVGMLAGPVPSFNTASLLFRRLRIGGVAVGSDSPLEQRAAWTESVALLERTGRRPEVDSRWPFEQVPSAFARLEEGPMGKVIVDVSGDLPPKLPHDGVGGGSSW